MRALLALVLVFPLAGLGFFLHEEWTEQTSVVADAEQIEATVQTFSALRRLEVWLSADQSLSLVRAGVADMGVTLQSIAAEEANDVVSFSDSQLLAAEQNVADLVDQDSSRVALSDRARLQDQRKLLGELRDRVDTPEIEAAEITATYERYINLVSRLSDRHLAEVENLARGSAEFDQLAQSVRALDDLTIGTAAAVEVMIFGLGYVVPVPGFESAASDRLDFAAAYDREQSYLTSFLSSGPPRSVQRLQELQASPENLSYLSYVDVSLRLANLVEDDEELEIPDSQAYGAVAYVRVAELANLSIPTSEEIAEQAAVVRAGVQDGFRQQLVVTLGVVAASIIAAMLAAWLLVNPLRRLQMRADLISKGQLASSDPLGAIGPREVAVVSVAMDQLESNLLSLDQQMHALADGELDEAATLGMPGPLGEAMGRTVSRLSEMTERLRSSEETARAVVSNAADAIMTVNAANGIVVANTAAAQLFGVRDELMLDMTVSDLLSEDSADAVKALLAAARHRGEASEQIALESAGSVRQILFSAQVHEEVAPGAEAADITVIGRDVTHRTRMEAELRIRSKTDGLTTLPNRASAIEHLERALHDRERTGREVGLMFVDLDRFKRVNDTYGHAAGDALLRVVAGRLTAMVGDRGVVARLGGDEFVVVLPEALPIDETCSLGSQIIERLEEPALADGARVEISACVGVALSRPGTMSAADLLREADLAVYSSKKRGGTVSVANDELRRMARRRQELDNALRVALRQQELRLHFQPVVEMTTGVVVGAEALARWDRRDEGPVSPEEFISVAEESSLVVDVGRWALMEACRAIAAIEAVSPTQQIPVAVNISWRHVTEGDLVADVRNALVATGIRPALLRVELTETGTPNDGSAASVLEELQELGVGMSLDDFGTGYSSLTHLRQFPFDTVKLDRSLIISLEDDVNDRSIVKLMVHLGDLLGISVIAEGVETPEQAEILQDFGCSLVQGYLYGRPDSLPGFLSELQRGNDEMSLPQAARLDRLAQMIVRSDV
jgi:diguanylate cyclase (GGDEF)-like protein/PAS domain S-box-containing protein